MAAAIRPRAMILGALLILSLAGNGVLGVRLRESGRRADDLARTLERQRQELDELRGRVRGLGGKDPLGRIAAAVEELRGLTFKRTIAPELLSPTGLARRVRRAVEKDNSRAEIEASARVLVALGLIPADLDLYELLLALQEEQVAGFYDTDDRTLVVGAADARNPSPFDRVILAHEYTHALTDQYFDLGRLDRLQDADKDDEAAAYLALVEGDATFTHTLYQRHVLTDDERRLFQQEALRAPLERFDSAPEFLQVAFSFPYESGLDFVREVHARGGFDLIDKAYEDPPVSTEQILHPSRYLDRRDDPTQIDLPDVAAALGAGWRVLERGGAGELDMRLIADLGGGVGLSGTDARRLGAGWDGGRYIALGSGAQTVLAILTAWDSEGEAREAGTLLGRWLPLRYGNRGQRFDPRGAGVGWRAPDAAAIVLRVGDRVLLLIGPDESAVAEARSAFAGF